jgi:hypothetical protein
METLVNIFKSAFFQQLSQKCIGLSSCTVVFNKDDSFISFICKTYAKF